MSAEAAVVDRVAAELLRAVLAQTGARVPGQPGNFHADLMKVDWHRVAQRALTVSIASEIADEHNRAEAKRLGFDFYGQPWRNPGALMDRGDPPVGGGISETVFSAPSGVSVPQRIDFAGYVAQEGFDAEDVPVPRYDAGQIRYEPREG